MAKERVIHPVKLDIKKALPAELDAGAPFSLRLAVETESGADLGGAPYEVRDATGVIATGKLPDIVRLTVDHPDYDPRHGPVDTRPQADITLRAPREVGSFSWTIVLPANMVGELAHGEARIPVAFATKAHITSMTIWDNPSPVVAGQRFSLKVGAKCSAGCKLTGHEVELIDASGAVVARGRLGEAPMTGTSALYWVEVEALAPLAQGQQTWSARFGTPKSDLPHAGVALARTDILTVPPADHTVRVRIVDDIAGAPVKSAQVRMGFYRAATDDTGWASLAVPRGEHRLFIWKAGYKVPERSVKVEDDLEVLLQAEKLPDVDVYARWKG